MTGFFYLSKMQKKTQKIIAGLAITLQFLVAIPFSMAEDVSPKENPKQKLLVTAYYSPLPDQSFYIRGSYEGDIKLNGRGTNGADGTEVFPGMLAAPKTYPFGTSVMIPGLGVGVVHDRGGAIFDGKDYDRIDVWMGYGEEGLSRALNWGARVVMGEVNFPPNQVSVSMNFDWVNSQLPQKFVDRLKGDSIQATPQTPSAQETPSAPDPVVSKAPEVVIPIPTDPLNEEDKKELERLEQNRTLLAAGLGKDATGDEVSNLQRMLWELGYYKGDINGTYDQVTVDAVFDFQVEYGVLKTEADLGAGYFGKKTLEALLSLLEKKIQALAQYPKEIQAWVPAKQVLPQIASLKLPEVSVERQTLNFDAEIVNKKIVQSTRISSEIGLNDQGEEVKKLQNFLIERGLLSDGLNTGYFGEQTQAALIKFQLAQGIVKSSLAGGAGRVGPQTLAAINSF